MGVGNKGRQLKQFAVVDGFVAIQVEIGKRTVGLDFCSSKFRRLQGVVLVLVKSEVMINQPLRVVGNPFQQSTLVESGVGHKAHVLGLFPDKLVAFAGFGNLLIGRLFILLDLADGKISQTQVSGRYLFVVRKVTNELLEQPNGVRVVVLGALISDGQSKEGILLVGLVRIMTRFSAIRPFVVNVFFSGADGSSPTHLVGNFPNRTIEPHEETFTICINVGFSAFRIFFTGRKVDTVGIRNHHRFRFRQLFFRLFLGLFLFGGGSGVTRFFQRGPRLHRIPQGQGSQRSK